MRHQAGDVASAIADARDVAHRAVGISVVVVGAARRRVTEQNPAISLEFGQRGFVRGVAAVAVGDGSLDDLPLVGGASERRIGLLDAEIYVAADESQAGIAHQRAGEQARFAENLETVAYAEEDTAGVCELHDRFHHGRKARYSAGAEIVSVGKTPGKDESVAV